MAKKKIRRKKKVVGTPERPRLVVYRSLKYIYGQLVDDTSRKTLIGVSNLTPELREQVAKAASKVEASRIVGSYMAKKALEMNIKRIVFDRNGYKYHGRVRAFAEGAREGGLEF